MLQHSWSDLLLSEPRSTPLDLARTYSHCTRTRCVRLRLTRFARKDAVVHSKYFACHPTELAIECETKQSASKSDRSCTAVRTQNCSGTEDRDQQQRQQRHHRDRRKGQQQPIATACTTCRRNGLCETGHLIVHSHTLKRKRMTLCRSNTTRTPCRSTCCNQLSQEGGRCSLGV